MSGRRPPAGNRSIVQRPQPEAHDETKHAHRQVFWLTDVSNRTAPHHRPRLLIREERGTGLRSGLTHSCANNGTSWPTQSDYSGGSAVDSHHPSLFIPCGNLQSCNSSLVRRHHTIPSAGCKPPAHGHMTIHPTANQRNNVHGERKLTRLECTP